MRINCVHCGVQFEAGAIPVRFCPSCSPVGKPFLSLGTYSEPPKSSDKVTHADICSRNPVLAASVLGCGQPIMTCAEVYRCVDCQTPFHKDCLHKHCEAELATWKARAKKAEQRAEEMSIKREEAFNKAASLIAERDTLKSLCEKMIPYASHLPTCWRNAIILHADQKCTCGLTELQKQVKEKGMG